MSTAHPNRELVDRLLGPADPEVSCEECFELLDWRPCPVTISMRSTRLSGCGEPSRRA